MSKHTPGPWKVGHGSFVIADTPIPEIGGSDSTEYYGGHLVAESIAPQNLEIIAAAPMMLEALGDLVSDIDLYLEWARRNGKTNSELERIGKSARSAIKQATGKESK